MSGRGAPMAPATSVELRARGGGNLADRGGLAVTKAELLIRSPTKLVNVLGGTLRKALSGEGNAAEQQRRAEHFWGARYTDT
jgi:hypothetical protein